MRWLAVALVLVAAPARADDGFFHRLATDARARIDAASAARVPAIVPPKSIVVRYRAQQIGTIELGAPLVAMTAADLDGDGKAELYAVTTREVIALGLVDHRVRELGRVAFSGEPAVPQSRDVVGSAIVDGGTIVASVSSWAHGVRASWKAKALVADPGPAGFELCAGEQAQLAPGKNFFGNGSSATFATRCRVDLVDKTGATLHARATLAITGKLDIVLEQCAPACREAARFSYDKVGVAFELADLDRDGTPEVIYAAAVAPGDPDSVRVVSLGDEARQAKLHKTFKAGGVAGIAVGDLDGDGTREAIAAVRLVGATRIDLWRLN